MIAPQVPTQCSLVACLLCAAVFRMNQCHVGIERLRPASTPIKPEKVIFEEGLRAGRSLNRKCPLSMAVLSFFKTNLV